MQCACERTSSIIIIIISSRENISIQIANELVKSEKGKMKRKTERERERERERDFFHLQDRFFFAKSRRGEKAGCFKGMNAGRSRIPHSRSNKSDACGITQPSYRTKGRGRAPAPANNGVAVGVARLKNTHANARTAPRGAMLGSKSLPFCGRCRNHDRHSS